MDGRVATLPRWLPLVVLLAAWLAHGGALAGGWLLEDEAVARRNVAFEAGIPGVLAADAWAPDETVRVWRPVTLISHALDARMAGEDAGALLPHLTNLLIHGLASLLALAVAAALLPGRTIAAAAGALVFAVHPALVAAVTPVLGRADLLAGLLGLATTWLWIRALGRTPALVPLVALGFFLALLAKESAAGLLVLLLGVAGVVRAPRARWAAASAVLGAVLVGWLLLRPVAAAEPMAALARAGLAGLAHQTLALVLPVGFVRDAATLAQPPATAGVLAGLGLLLAALGLALWTRRRGGASVAATLLALFAGSFVAGALVSPAGSPLAVRYLYPFAGPATLVLGLGIGALAASLARTRVGPALAPAAALLPVLLGLGVLTRAETAVWADDAALQPALVAAAPDRPEIRIRHAWRLLERAERTREALADRPSSEEEAGRLRAQMADDVAAAALGARAVTHKDPKEARGWRLLGAVALLQGNAPTAETALRRGLELDPFLKGARSPDDLSDAQRLELADAYHRLGLALEAQGRPEVALEHLALAARLAPSNAAILGRAGRACLRAGRDQQGLLYLRRAIDQAPDEASRRRLETEFDQARAAALRRADQAIERARVAEYEADYRAALGAYEEALLADPSRLEAYLRLAWLRGEYFGDFRRARALLEQARSMLGGEHGDEEGLARIEEALVRLDEQQRAADEDEED